MNKVECRRYEVQSDVWCHIMSRVRDITMPPQFGCRMVGLWISKGKTDHVIIPPRKRLLYALLSALRIKIFKILWCSNKRVILSMKSVSLKFFDRETS